MPSFPVPLTTDEGTGPAVVLLHGFPHDRALWRHQVAALSDAHRCIAPDLPGFGSSSPLPAPTVEAYADAVVALLDELGVARATVAGLSMGGYVAFALWRRYPERVRALILCDTKSGADTDEARAKRRDLIAVAERDGAAAVAATQLDGMLGKTTRATRPAVVSDVRAMMERQPVIGITGALTALMQRPDSTSLLGDISVPVLVAVGDEDTLTPPKEALAMHRAIRTSTLVEIAQSGHATALEQPAAVNAAFRAFLGSLPAA